MHKKLKIFHIAIGIFLSTNSIFAQYDLRSGPLNGGASGDSIAIWVQAFKPSKIKISCQSLDFKSFDSKEIFSKEESTGELNIATLILKNLKPEGHYSYRVFVNEKEQIFDFTPNFRMPPVKYRLPQKNFKFAAGSCALLMDSPYNAEKKLELPPKLKHDIYKQIVNHNPDAMLWLGDNVYMLGKEMYDMKGIQYRYTYCRSLPETRRLFGECINVATWDDHDFGANDADGNYILKDSSTKVFKMFWPNPVDSQVKFKGIATSFVWGDAEFLFLDDRYHRYPSSNNENKMPTMLGKEQLDWLKLKLRESNAKFKFIVIGTQLFNFTHIGESGTVEYETEINNLWKYIVKEKIEGVVFISGDRHYSEVSRWVPEGGYPFYEFCLSPLLSPPSGFLLWKQNPYRVGNYKAGVRNFAICEISGPETDRKFITKIYNKKGKFLWEYILPLSELKFKK